MKICTKCKMEKATECFGPRRRAADGLKKWHIDHIIPVARFDLTDAEQQRRCFHYSNLQPLWAADNLAKSDRVVNNVTT